MVLISSIASSDHSKQPDKTKCFYRRYNQQSLLLMTLLRILDNQLIDEEIGLCQYYTQCTISRISHALSVS